MLTEPDTTTGKISLGDRALILVTVALVIASVAFRPFHSFLIEHHPLLLALLTGSPTSISASAAFARVEGTSIFLPIIAGTLGSVKFYWVLWWASRRWKVLAASHAGSSFTLRWNKYFTKEDKIRRRSIRFTAGTRFFTWWRSLSPLAFMGLSFLAVLSWTTVLALTSYGLGSHMVDLVLLASSNAVWIGLALASWIVLDIARRKRKGKV